MGEHEAILAYATKHGGCDIQRHPWQAVFGAGYEAGRAEVARLQAENERLRAALIGVATFGSEAAGDLCWCPESWEGAIAHTIACSKAEAALTADDPTPRPAERGVVQW